jgi:MSHA biogenesis protein MshO
MLRSRPDGFTLIELVVVISIGALLTGLLTSFVVRPMEGYVDATRRAELVDLSEEAIRRMARDIRRALPNSVRVSGSGRVLELLHTADGGRYRSEPGTNSGTSEDHTAAVDRLDFTGDAQWNILGRFHYLGFTYGVALPAGTRIAIYPTGTQTYIDAATDANPGVITPSATSVTIADDSDEDQIQLSASHDFSFTSPGRRLYVVDTPVTYLCDLGAGTLARYESYSIASAQPTDPGLSPLSGASSALVADGLSACTFTYSSGSTQRGALVKVDLTIASGGEQVRLLHQVHVSNAP